MLWGNEEIRFYYKKLSPVDKRERALAEVDKDHFRQ